jgi:hypothetical protein
MKKLMTLMLGLSLVLGSTALFGGDDTDTTKKSGKKKGGKKKKDTTETKG